MAISPRRAREIARTRQDILDAAARAFASRGFAGATMQEIAREAGYTAASLYSYFSSKEEIIQELFAAILRERENLRAMPMPSALSPRQKLEIFLRRQHDFASRHRDVIRFFLLSGNLPGGLASSLGTHCATCPTPIDVSAAEMEAFFREHLTPEELCGWPYADAALALAGLLHGFFLRWLRSDGAADADISAGIPCLVDFFFGGLLASGQTQQAEEEKAK